MKSEYKVQKIRNIGMFEINAVAKESDIFISFRGESRTDKLITLFSEYGEKRMVKYFVNKGQSKDEVTRDIKDCLNLLSTKNEEFIVLAIDISLIPRALMAEIFALVIQLSECKNVELNILYSLATYSPPNQSLPPNERVNPVNKFFSGWPARPGLPVMAIVGLGYERDKALGAIEYLESTKSTLFVPNSSEEEYRKDILSQNETLIKYKQEEDCIDYDVENPAQTLYQIDSILSGHKNSFKMVLLPFGPKIYYAASLLAAIAHREVSVWHVSGEDKESIAFQDRQPAKTFGMSCVISNS